MKINLTTPIYPQIKNLSPIKYKEVTETILLKENDVYDYNTIQLYQSKFINFLTKSSLKMCYVFWIPIHKKSNTNRMIIDIISFHLLNIL